MKNSILTALLLLPVTVFAGEPVAEKEPPESDTDMLEESRALTQRFAETLQAELMRAISGFGPPEAVRVCRDRAPEIAAELARESGAKIGRTSLRFRNPQNIPEPWQIPVLMRFEQAGASAKQEKLELFERNPAPGIEARYMKAIIAKPLCLACHGEPDQPVAEELRKAYPHDRAVGYEAGDIRGAFYVIWPEPHTHDID